MINNLINKEHNMSENIDFCEVCLDDRAYTIKEEETILPNENKVKYYQDKYEIFKKLYPALKVLYRKDNL